MYIVVQRCTLLAFEWKIGKIMANLFDFLNNEKYLHIREQIKNVLNNKLHFITNIKMYLHNLLDELHQLNENLRVMNAEK